MQIGRGALVLMGMTLTATVAQAASGQRGEEPIPQRGAMPPVSPAPARGQPLVAEAKPKPGETPAQTRTRIQQVYRQMLANHVRQQLGLNPAQMAKLMNVDRDYERQFRQLNQDYVQTAQQERKALQSPNIDSPQNQKLLSDLDSRVRQIHGRWDDLDSTEQKDLAGFLTPSQRIKFNVIKENLQRQIKAVSGGLSPMPEPPPLVGPRRGGSAPVKPDSGRFPLGLDQR